jgi:hypothetical protein
MSEPIHSLLFIYAIISMQGVLGQVSSIERQGILTPNSKTPSLNLIDYSNYNSINNNGIQRVTRRLRHIYGLRASNGGG